MSPGGERTRGGQKAAARSRGGALRASSKLGDEGGGSHGGGECGGRRVGECRGGGQRGRGKERQGGAQQTHAMESRWGDACRVREEGGGITCGLPAWLLS